jgi:CLIP-associating protein 1/2
VQGKETEHNWAARERAIQRVRGMLKGDVHSRYSEQFLNSLKEFTQWSLKAVISFQVNLISDIYFPLASKFAYDSGC